MIGISSSSVTLLSTKSLLWCLTKLNPTKKLLKCSDVMLLEAVDNCLYKFCCNTCNRSLSFSVRRIEAQFLDEWLHTGCL